MNGWKFITTKSDDLKFEIEYLCHKAVNNNKNKISKNNPDTLISKNEIEFFFNANNENFKLYEEIIKGRYVKLKINAFNIDEIKRRFRRYNVSDKYFFDSISIQLLNYYLNDSIWTNKKLFFKKIQE